MENKVLVRGKFVHSFPDSGALIERAVRVKCILIAINAEKILNEDADLQRIINNNIGYPDGIGAVLALRRKGIKAVRIPGVELWLDIVKKYSPEKTFYLIGSTDQVVQRTAERLKEKFPSIRILGYRNGYLEEEENESVCRAVQELKPDFVFVAMGSPRQELLMEKLMSAHRAVYVGLGGAFDVFSGIKKRAPEFLRRIGLEWLYRLIKEPIRIKRQLKFLKFSYMLTTNKL